MDTPHVHRPVSDTVSRAICTAIVVCSVAIYYPSSDIEFEIVGGTVDLKAAEALGSVQTINGFSAMVLPGLPDGHPPVPATVSIPLENNRTVELAGPSASELVGVAQTLSIPAPSSP